LRKPGYLPDFFCRRFTALRRSIYSTELAAEVFDTGNEFVNLMLIVLLVVTAGVLGNTLGYWFGAKSGPYLF
jgi:membrane-associated protein